MNLKVIGLSVALLGQAPEKSTLPGPPAVGPVATPSTATPQGPGPVDEATKNPLCDHCERSLELRADALAARAQELAAREAQVRAGEEALKAYKAGFQTQVDTLLGRITALEKQLDIGEGARQAREQRMSALADTLTTLSAKKAAPMLATADPELVGDILLRLGAQRSAALLALMPPNRAARFLEQVGAPPSKAATATPGTASEGAKR